MQEVALIDIRAKLTEARLSGTHLVGLHLQETSHSLGLKRTGHHHGCWSDADDDDDADDGKIDWKVRSQ